MKSMKVLLYLEGKSVLEKSGIGRALHHQMHALDLAGIPYTTDILGDYDVVHINTWATQLDVVACCKTPWQEGHHAWSFDT